MTGDELDPNVLQERQRMLEQMFGSSGGFGLDRDPMEQVGGLVGQEIMMGYRGAERFRDALLAIPEGVWGDRRDEFLDTLLIGALTDLAVAPRYQDLDRTLEWAVTVSAGRLVRDAVDACVDMRDTVGTDKGQQIVEQIDRSHTKLGDLRKKDGKQDWRYPLQIVDYQAKLAAGVGFAKSMALSREQPDTLQDSKARDRLDEKKQDLSVLESALGGVSAAARFLTQLVYMQVDVEGPGKIFVGAEPEIPAHLLRFLCLSPRVDKAVTVAFRMLTELEYRRTDGKGNVILDGALDKKGVHVSIAARDGVTAPERDEFMRIWEETVREELGEGGEKQATRLAGLGVSLAMFMSEICKMGANSDMRDRVTGRLLDVDNVGGVKVGGVGSVYPGFGGSDYAEKVHGLRNRFMAEKRKGRKSPTMAFSMSLMDELLVSFMHLKEAKLYKPGEKPKALGVSAMEAILDKQSGFTMKDLVFNLAENDQFLFMLFAFRAGLIHVKLLDGIRTGTISSIAELGGGPEQLVMAQIDVMTGLHKAAQQAQFPVGNTMPWHMMEKDASGNKTKRAEQATREKDIEIARFMVNLMADFIRYATQAAAVAGGVTDNPDWRGLGDKLGQKVYERIATHTNVMTAQQYWLAWEYARNNIGGGMVTREMVEGKGAASEALRQILGADLTKDAQSVVNVTEVRGGKWPVATTDSGKADRDLQERINLAANRVVEGPMIAHSQIPKGADLDNTVVEVSSGGITRKPVKG